MAAIASILLAAWATVAIGLLTGEERRSTLARAALRGGGEAGHKYNPPQFYDAFSSAETSWDYDAAQVLRADNNDFHNYVDGYSPPDVANPFDPKEVPPAYFHESESFGAKQALQTDPQASRGPAGHNNLYGSWYQDSAGKYIQSYQYQQHDQQQSDVLAKAGDLYRASRASGAKTPDWFDTSVNQFDNYGRPKSPFPGNPVRLENLGYMQEAVNTSVSCKAAGCNASSLLHAFKVGKDVQSCKLSVLVKPTDFGKGKIVEFISANGVNVSVNCQPSSSALAAGACSKEEASDLSQLYTCVQDVDVLHLLGTDGVLTVSAKISPSVTKTDCAYQGNLLYAIPQVTCMVGTPRPEGNVSALKDLPKATPMKFSKSV